MDKPERIRGLIESWQQEQLRFLISLCEINSYTLNKKGTDWVASQIQDRLGEIFPYHEIEEQEKHGNHHIFRTSMTGNSVYLLGHMDTVFPPDHPFQSCHMKDGWLMGPGTADMKGGLAVLIYALRALRQVDAFPDFEITLILGADEETGSTTSRDIYLRERTRALACLTAESAGEMGEFVISRNGKMGGLLECFGKDRHVGAPESAKSSAILEMAHKIIAIEALNRVHPGVRLNAGRVEGGLGPATVPGYASLLFDVRWEKEEQHDEVYASLLSIAENNHDIHCRSKMSILNHRPAMPAGEKTKMIADMLINTGRKLDMNILFQHRRGTSDANFFGSAGIPTLDGFGPIGLQDHTSEERILISSLAERTQLLALLLFTFEPDQI